MFTITDNGDSITVENDGLNALSLLQGFAATLNSISEETGYTIDEMFEVMRKLNQKEDN